MGTDLEGFIRFRYSSRFCSFLPACPPYPIPEPKKPFAFFFLPFTQPFKAGRMCLWVKHCVGKMTLHFPGALTKPFDLNVNAVSMIKCKIHFYIPQLQNKFYSSISLPCGWGIRPLKVAMVMWRMRMVLELGLEPSEFPRTETGRMTGWEDGIIHFSLEPCWNAVFLLYLRRVDSPSWYMKMMSFLLRERIGHRQAFCLFSLSVSNHLLSCDINWDVEIM